MPLLWLGVCIISGILSAAYFQVAWIVWPFLFIGSLLIAVIEWIFAKKHPHPLLDRILFRIPFGLLLAGFALGGWRFNAALPVLTPFNLAYYLPQKEADVAGTIVSFPELSTNSSIAIVKAETLIINGQQVEVDGKLELRLPGGFHLTYGDRLLLRGKLSAVLKEGEAPFSSSLARRGVLSRMSYPQVTTLGFGYGSPLMAFLFQVRDKARIFLESQLPGQEASLLSGILLGIDWRIPDFLRDAYRASGTAHIIAISGFNIAILSALVIRFFRRFFNPVWAGILAVFAILFYVILVGAEAPVVRAAVMGSLSLPAYYIGRRIIGLHSLTIAAAAMLLANPLLLWDIGFQLSFFATLGLMVLADPAIEYLRDWLDKKYAKVAGAAALPVAELAISTLCAQFAVAPVILAMRPSLQPFALPANLILLPLQPPLMIVGGLAVLAGFVSLPLGSLLAWLVWPMARLSNLIAARIGLLPYAEITLPAWSAWLAGVPVLATMILATTYQIVRLSTSNKKTV